MLGGDEIDDRARAGFRLVAERDRDLAADLAGVGWRSQKPRMSETAALASVTACVASICASGFVFVPPLGSSRQTSPSQNAIRNRKNMTRSQSSPAAFSPPLN